MCTLWLPFDGFVLFLFCNPWNFKLLLRVLRGIIIHICAELKALLTLNLRNEMTICKMITHFRREEIATENGTLILCKCLKELCMQLEGANLSKIFNFVIVFRTFKLASLLCSLCPNHPFVDTYKNWFLFKPKTSELSSSLDWNVQHLYSLITHFQMGALYSDPMFDRFWRCSQEQTLCFSVRVQKQTFWKVHRLWRSWWQKLVLNQDWYKQQPCLWKR